ncbi:uncharacterized protein MELLADRAFT_34736 [Melampsora larici-populina 98AG31]|uniref:Helitron helicase-like domain-containing protein n=1 Tax=Melampsora larici-populina (strain 98AG31 / pathotype 3-4-7) TaxID=747676 RepID=F4RF70_MELLP|nr:uncharacterized protein MELLADRAFT_34736 [Melampsora larici-populina 98AG31]EGG08986.1 hypothetical protein MELLADRAFT_34736 [Melampsora larici-populina 98AG31]
MSSSVGLAVRNPSENAEISILRRFPRQIPHYLGPQDHVCQHCGAFRWGQERTQQNIKDKKEVYTNCCQKGDVKLPIADFDGDPIPDYLRHLLIANDAEFQKYIIRHNNAIAFASMCVDFDGSITGPHRSHTFRMAGELKHLIGSMYPDNLNRPVFAQIFFLGDGGQDELNKRMNWHTKINDAGQRQEMIKRRTLRKLQDLMNDVNIYARYFKMAATILTPGSTKRIMLKTLPPGPRESRTYNRPNFEEVAALVEEGQPINDQPRQFIMHTHGSALKPMTDLHTSYFSLRYPLLMPYGSQSWDKNYVSPTAGTNPGRKLCLSLYQSWQ